MNLIQAQIDAREQATEDIDGVVVKLTDFGKVIFGAAKPSTMLEDAQKNHGGLLYYKNFDLTVNQFFKEQVKAGHKIEQQPGETTEYVQSYYSVRSYTSIHHWVEIDWPNI